ncbi:uncharacterized protein BJ212DRAFT_141559 [Suillus subaureus]|uniref:Hydrophobin n=1 Tax=Suillus subaureus TaxID=48587 RepID=A0A9P7ECE1_9AGAM|nr:uncharacterized protein BJ212DRAFT_141559 [Suillus subaureus]KAG1817712.1 hypothetical protein BJ212DRAFT_141559 [Suillus subaureus]
MMFLFRSMFITAISAFVMALFLFSMSASAMPQFGRPLLHALDAVTTSSGPFEAVPTSTTASTGTDPDPDPQVIQAVSSPSVCIYHFSCCDRDIDAACHFRRRVQLQQRQPLAVPVRTARRVQLRRRQLLAVLVLTARRGVCVVV